MKTDQKQREKNTSKSFIQLLLLGCTVPVWYGNHLVQKIKNNLRACAETMGNSNQCGSDSLLSASSSHEDALCLHLLIIYLHSVCCHWNPTVSKRLTNLITLDSARLIRLSGKNSPKLLWIFLYIHAEGVNLRCNFKLMKWDQGKDRRCFRDAEVFLKSVISHQEVNTECWQIDGYSEWRKFS